MSKFNLKPKAFSLRKKGYSLKEIADTLKISKSTAGIWCRDISLESEALARLSHKSGDGKMKGRLLGAQTNKRLQEERVCAAEEWAKQKIAELSKRDLLLLGIGLYWGEGAKARKLNFTNSDPLLLVVMKKWFEDIFNVLPQDFLVRVYIHESHKDRYKKIKSFWIETLTLPVSQFYEPTFLKTKLQKVYENRETYYGVVSLRIRKSTELQYKILGLIKAVRTADVAQVVRAHHS